MKTPRQLRNTANGMDRIKSAALKATTPLKSISKDGCNYGSFYSNHFAPLPELMHWSQFVNDYSIHKLELAIYSLQKDKDYNYLPGY